MREEEGGRRRGRKKNQKGDTRTFLLFYLYHFLIICRSGYNDYQSYFGSFPHKNLIADFLETRTHKITKYIYIHIYIVTNTEHKIKKHNTNKKKTKTNNKNTNTKIKASMRSEGNTNTKSLLRRFYLSFEITSHSMEELPTHNALMQRNFRLQFVLVFVCLFCFYLH